ncbi:MAG: VanZ family protein [Nitrospira sp.]
MRLIATHFERGIPWWIGLFLLALLLVLPNILAVRLSKVWLQFPGLDKPTHFIAFIVVFLIVYGVVRSRWWPPREREKLGLAVCISLGISLVDEAQQAMLGMGRTAEYGDLVADAAGILVGLTGTQAGQLGLRRAAVIIALLFIPVAAATARTYQDLKHFNRGMVYEREHDYQRARAEYKLALDSGFQSAELYNAIAWLDIEFLGADPVETEQYTAKAFALNSNNPDILDTHGWVLVREGRTREGLVFLERAKTVNPNIYCIDLHLGVAYLELGKRSLAIEYLTRQVERNPEDRFGRSASKVLTEME